MKKIKFLILIICLTFISFLVYLCFFDDSLFSVDVDFSNLSQNDVFVVGISCDNNVAAFDLDAQTYYFSKSTFDLGKLKVISPYKTKYNVEKVTADKYVIDIYSDKYYQQRYIQILDSNIVLVKSFYDIEKRGYVDVNSLILYGKKYSDVYVQVMDNDYLAHNSSPISKYYFGKFRVRGASSFAAPKKSYKIELNEKVSMFGMAKDEDWILDSLYSDKSKIRNKLSSDLWSDINYDQKISNDLDGRFVELFLNNEYKGAYVLKEKVDKKKTNVGESGLLVKSITHVNDDIRNRFIINNVNLADDEDDTFLENYEVKYYSNISLNRFISMLGDYYYYGDYNSIYRNFDVDNFLNYKVLVMLISGEDNLTKNQYLSLQDSDSKILITPWDMDLTWGLNWSDSNNLLSEFSMESSSDINWMNENITKSMDEKTLSLMKQRYWELRKNVITMDTINGYLDSYKELLVNSGAAKRDSERWYEYDVEFEIEQIREWARRRIEFLDEYFK